MRAVLKSAARGPGAAPASASALPTPEDKPRGQFLPKWRKGEAKAAKPEPAPAADLEASMAELHAALGPVPLDGGRVLMFVAAATGEGSSTLAREFAAYAAKRARRPVWLVDLDLMGQTQHAALAAEPSRFGALGPASQASPDGSSFVNVQPSARTADGKVLSDARYLAGHAVFRGRLWVTRFRKEALRPGQQVRLSPSPAYWRALAKHAEYVVIDVPAADRSTAALTLASQVDASVLVVSADGSDARAPAALKQSLEAHGGRIAGLVFNRAPRTPRFLEKLLS
jgi:Mrp family chromosome partitioning ATPase